MPFKESGDNRLENVQDPKNQSDGHNWNALENAQLGNPHPPAEGNMEWLRKTASEIFSGRNSTTGKEITPGARVEQQRSEGDQTDSWSTLSASINKLNPRRFTEFSTTLGVLITVSMIERVHGQAVLGNATVSNYGEGFSVSPTITSWSEASPTLSLTKLNETFAEEFPTLTEVLKVLQSSDTTATPHDAVPSQTHSESPPTGLAKRSGESEKPLDIKRAEITEPVNPTTTTEIITQDSTINADSAELASSYKQGFKDGMIHGAAYTFLACAMTAGLAMTASFFCRPGRRARRDDVELQGNRRASPFSPHDSQGNRI